jgi:hypothetical protein
VYADTIADGCRQVDALRRSGNISEPHWYAVLGVLARCEDGEVKAHELDEISLAMTLMTPTFALACWERAAGEEIGLIIEFENLEARRSAEKMLYESRTESQNPAYENLMIARPGDAPNELWVIKKATDMKDVL